MGSCRCILVLFILSGSCGILSIASRCRGRKLPVGDSSRKSYISFSWWKYIVMSRDYRRDGSLFRYFEKCIYLTITHVDLGWDALSASFFIGLTRPTWVMCGRSCARLHEYAGSMKSNFFRCKYGSIPVVISKSSWRYEGSAPWPMASIA